jgi:AcrR family transcriptional regulator
MDGAAAAGWNHWRGSILLLGCPLEARPMARKLLKNETQNVKWDGVGLTRKEVHGAKRRALVATANQIFRKKGYYNTSMDDVARFLNVSKTVVYYYVKNKQELLFLCYQLAFEYGAEAQAYAEKHGRNGREKLEMLLRHYTISLIEKLGGGGLMSEDSALTPEHLATVQENRRSWNRVFRAFVKEGIAGGQIRKCDARLIEFFVMGAIRNIHHWYSAEGQMGGEQIADELVKFVFDGIAARGARGK